MLERDYNYRIPVHHSDVKHGFVISFQQLPAIDLEQLEAKVKEIIAADVPSPRGRTGSPSATIRSRARAPART